MADRRVGDRREPEKGVINIKFRDAVIYSVIAAVLIILVSANIILIIKNKDKAERIENLEQGLYEFANPDLLYEEDYDIDFSEYEYELEDDVLDDSNVEEQKTEEVVDDSTTDE